MAKTPENPFDIDFGRLLGEFRVPGVDVQAIVTSQRKNVEALTQANRLAMEGMQALFKRQTEILRQTMEESAAAARSLTTTGDPKEVAIRQTEKVKDAFERSLANARELSEIVSKSNSEAFELLNKRFTGILDEIKDELKKKAK